MARFLGIDIDKTAVRGAVVKTAFRRIEVERYVEIPLTHLADDVGRLPEVQDALGNLLRAIGKAPDAVMTSLSGAQASLRVLELPAAASKRIIEVLPFELESMLPFDIADAVVEHQPIYTKDGLLHVLAAAALRTRVSEQLSVFNGTAIEPRELAVGAAALDGLRLLCPELQSGTAGVLEIAGRESSFCVIEQGKLTFARTISAGRDVIPDTAGEIVQGVHQSLSAYLNAGGSPVQTLYVCGAELLPDFAPWLSEQINLRTEVLTMPAAVGGDVDDPPAFARALALASRAALPGKRINLRIGEFAATRTRNELMGQLNLVLLCAAAVLVAVVFSMKARQSMLLDEQAALQKQLGDTTENIFGHAEMNAQKVEALIQNPQSDDPLPRFDAYDALAAISASVPQEITHEVRHLRIDLAEDKKEGQLELQGALASIEQRDQIVAHLGEHGCFTEIQRGKTSPGRSGDQINYELEAKVLCPGDEPVAKKHKKVSSDE